MPRDELRSARDRQERDIPIDRWWETNFRNRRPVGGIKNSILRSLRLMPTFRKCPACGSSQFTHSRNSATGTSINHDLYMLFLFIINTANTASGNATRNTPHDIINALNTFASEAAKVPPPHLIEIAVACPSDSASGAHLLLNWTRASDVRPISLRDMPNSPLGPALLCGLDLIESRKTDLRLDGKSYLRPWTIVITHADLVDEETSWTEVCMKIKEAVKNSKVLFFPYVTTPNAVLSRLTQMYPTPQPFDSFSFDSTFGSILFPSEAARIPQGAVPLPPDDPWADIEL